jgi:hypothetical protein
MSVVGHRSAWCDRRRISVAWRRGNASAAIGSASGIPIGGTIREDLIEQLLSGSVEVKFHA